MSLGITLMISNIKEFKTSLTNGGKFSVLELGLLDVARVVFGFSKTIIILIDNRNSCWIVN